ncbi:MAG: GIY-YIG nuclease family protein [Bacteroidetes bacterium]|nr:GIY-YIG nuclease family protein [Bacteroidota bacterium]
MKNGYTYLISNYERTVLYIGVTNDIERRMMEHKSGSGSIFSSQYKCKYLMFFEEFQTISDAIEREKQLKNWRKEWKWNLIKENNPELVDLSHDWFTNEQIENCKIQLDPETSSG